MATNRQVIGIENITGKVVWIVNSEDLQCGRESRTVQRHYFENFYEVIAVESFHETAYEGFIDTLLISNHVVDKVINQAFIETKNPPATTDVYVKPGEYHVNLFSEDHDKNLFSEDCKEAFTPTGKRVRDLFEGRDYKVFTNDLVISRPAYQSHRPSKELA